MPAPAIAGAALVGGSMLSKGSKQGGTSTTVQNAEPWAGVQPYLLDTFGRGQALANRDPFDYAASPFTSEAERMIAARARDTSSLIGRSQSLLGDTISGEYLSPDSNPFLRPSVEDALGLAGSTFAKQYGGSAGSNLSNSGYQEGLARTLGKVATNAYSDAYGRERQNQLNAMAFAPNMMFADAEALAGVGSADEARRLSQYNSPWDSLANYKSILSGQFGGQTTTQTPFYTNPTANALGSGLGILALANGARGLF